MQHWKLPGRRRLPAKGADGWQWTVEPRAAPCRSEWMLGFGVGTARATLCADHVAVGVLAGGLDPFVVETLSEDAARWLVARGLRQWQRECMRAHGVTPALQSVNRLTQAGEPERPDWPELPHRLSLAATKNASRALADLHCNAAGLELLLRVSRPLPAAAAGWGGLPVVMQVERGGGTLTLEDVASLKEGDLVTLDHISAANDLCLRVEGRDFGRAAIAEQGLIVKEIHEVCEEAFDPPMGIREIQGPCGLRQLEISVSVELARLAVPLPVLLALEPGSVIPLRPDDGEREYVLRVQDVAVAVGRVEVHPHSGLAEPSFTVTRVHGAVAAVPSIDVEPPSAASD